MEAQLKKVSAKEAEARLREGRTLEGCEIQDVLVLSGSYCHPIKIERCNVREIRGVDSTFRQKIQFHGSIFSKANFNRATFKQEVDWTNISITGPASFEGVVFEGATEFTDAHFLDEVVFCQAHFIGECDMDEVGFEHAEFGQAVFESRSDFSYSVFDELADFSKARFENEALFDHAEFKQGADFGGASFMGKAAFEEAVFSRNGFFNEAKFHKTADFDKGEFHRHADFRRAMFRGPVEFRDANVSAGAHFNYTAFEDRCDFKNSTFGIFNCIRAEISEIFNFESVKVRGSVDLEETSFKSDANFSHTRIEGKANFEKVRFIQADFSHGKFFGRVDFSDVLFRRQVNFQDAMFDDSICLLAHFPNGAQIQWRQLERGSETGLIDKKPKLLGRVRNLFGVTDIRICHSRRKNHDEARKEFGRLKKIFESNNDYDSMDRAYELFRHHENMGATKARVFKRLNTFFLKKCTGYGTQPLRVFLATLGIITVFSVIYSFLGDQTFLTDQPQPAGGFGWDFYLYFSLTTFFAGGAEGIHPDFGGWVKTLVAVETILGYLLMALFVVMLARKLVR